MNGVVSNAEGQVPSGHAPSELTKVQRQIMLLDNHAQVQ
jgi:hypothetical protein